MLGTVFLLALRSIRRHLLRSFLTILGIVIGVGAVVTMVTLGKATTAAVQQQISALAAALAIAPPSTPSAPSSSAPSAPATDAAALVTGLAQSESATSAQCRELAISQKAQRAPLLASLAASHQAASVTLA